MGRLKEDFLGGEKEIEKEIRRCCLQRVADPRRRWVLAAAPKSMLFGARPLAKRDRTSTEDLCDAGQTACYWVVVIVLPVQLGVCIGTEIAVA